MDFPLKGERVRTMYTLELDKEQVKTYVVGLDSSIKLIANQLLQQNAPTALRTLLPQLISINDELTKLDKIIDETDKKEVPNGADMDKQIG